jgi:hypothetical protein
MGISYALTTKERVKARLQITTTSFDDIFDRMIASETDRIERITGRRFKQGAVTNELHSGKNEFDEARKLVILKNAPVSTVASITYATGAPSDPTWVTLSADSYDIALADGIIYNKFPRGISNIRVNYTAGYLIDFTNEYSTTQHTLPYDISEVCEELVVKRFKKRDSEGRANESFQESSITWETEPIDKEQMRVIRSYSRGDI